MIGFNHLGNLGRLGNQMFEFAALRGIAAKHGYDWCIPADGSRTANYGIHHPFKLKHLKHIGEVPYPTKDEAHFHFDEELFAMCPDHVSLQGYFQTEKYFKHIADEIREDFTFKDEILNPCKEMISGVENPIALHVRRTDYVSNSANHPPCTLEYYEAALKHFDDNRNVIVFSDDPAWCQEQELFSNDRFMISENDDNRVDLCLMSLCNDFIIANSSYSWWGAWLSSNKNKKVIAPNRWFGENGYTKDHDTKDLIPNDWTRIIA